VLGVELILTIKEGFLLQHCAAILWHCIKIFNSVNF